MVKSNFTNKLCCSPKWVYSYTSNPTIYKLMRQFICSSTASNCPHTTSKNQMISPKITNISLRKAKTEKNQVNCDEKEVPTQDLQTHLWTSFIVGRWSCFPITRKKLVIVLIIFFTKITIQIKVKNHSTKYVEIDKFRIMPA